MNTDVRTDEKRMADEVSNLMFHGRCGMGALERLIELGDPTGVDWAPHLDNMQRLVLDLAAAEVALSRLRSAVRTVRSDAQ